jgi:hypothetical protein
MSRATYDAVVPCCDDEMREVRSRSIKHLVLGEDVEGKRSAGQGQAAIQRSCRSASGEPRPQNWPEEAVITSSLLRRLPYPRPETSHRG